MQYIIFFDKIVVTYVNERSILMKKEKVLKKYFGHRKFRDGQSEIIDNILEGNDILGIMPTGAGKSMCYQVPALMMEGITIVISPLISLMIDQVNSLVQSGVAAAYINSSLTLAQQNKVVSNIYKGMYKIIYVAPERLELEGFIRVAQTVKISMITIDEAHCVSQWGHDFRPGYLKIEEFIKKLSYRPIIAAFTATATDDVREDIIRILKLNNPYVKVTGFNRENLYFEVQRPKDKFTALCDILDRHKNQEKRLRKCVKDLMTTDMMRQGITQDLMMTKGRKIKTILYTTNVK